MAIQDIYQQVKKYAQLSVVMARVRIVAIICTSLLIGMATGDGAFDFLATIWTVLLLGASYACATSINDIADTKVDAINKTSAEFDRPLVNGLATQDDLVIVAVACGAISIFCGLVISQSAFVISIVLVIISLIYSLPPLKLAYRPLGAPILLPIGYAVAPYILGGHVTGANFSAREVILGIGLYFLLMARVFLKDFRDQIGDAQIGKMTFLVEYGKRSTVVASGCALSFGLFCVALAVQSTVLTVFIFAYEAVLLAMLFRLNKLESVTEQRIAIGVGAKVGNGLMLSIASTLLLAQQNAGSLVIAAVCGGLLLTALANLEFLRRDPDEMIQGYRG